MDSASRHGEVQVLRWWKNSGRKLRFTIRAQRGAAQMGKINSLQWWLDSGLTVDWFEVDLHRYGDAQVRFSHRT
ncbi:hypothetical protein DFJ73DRAFT_871620 [Zopfochytrium polystomum]|nr:hypothetical protein DFJ73DRAFT_871620 [Zopfochytrium polystomum]